MPRLGTEELRRKGRLKVPRIVRVRLSEPGLTDFDEILPTQNAALDSVYFVSKNRRCKQGLRVFITYPYSDEPGSINREFLGKVVRIEELDHGRRGIAIQMLMPLHVSAGETLRQPLHSASRMNEAAQTTSRPGTTP